MPIFMLLPSDVREKGEEATLPSIDTSASAQPGAIRGTRKPLILTRHFRRIADLPENRPSSAEIGGKKVDS
jgi:hypothetical protein